MRSHTLSKLAFTALFALAGCSSSSSAGTTPPPADGGKTDAKATPDAGKTDAKATPDAGKTDAKTKPDTGVTTDGATTDAVTTDAVTTDAVTTDAVTGDAVAPVDAALTDAQVAQLACQQACETNNADAFKSFQGALLTSCGCGATAAASPCMTECASACPAGTAAPSSACSACLDGQAQMGGQSTCTTTGAVTCMGATPPCTAFVTCAMACSGG